MNDDRKAPTRVVAAVGLTGPETVAETARTGGEIIPFEAPEGLENVLPDDLVVPRLIAVQPTSRVGTPGRWRCSLTGEEREQVRIVPLAVRRGRLLWAAPGSDGEVLCRSDDGFRPAASIEKPQSAVCAVASDLRVVPTCAKAIWNGNGRPACRELRSVLALDLDVGLPAVMTFSGMGLRMVKVLLTTIYRRRSTLCDVEVTLRLRLESGARGKFYVPEIAKIEAANPPGRYRRHAELFGRVEIEPGVDHDDAGNGSNGAGRIAPES